MVTSINFGSIEVETRPTEIGSIESLVGESDGEAIGVELSNGEAATVYGDRVPNRAIGEDGRGVGDDETVSLVALGRRGNFGDMTHRFH